MGKHKRKATRSETAAHDTLNDQVLAALAQLKPTDIVTKLSALTGKRGRIDIPTLLDEMAREYVSGILREKLRAALQTADLTLVRIEIIDDTGFASIEAPVLKPKSLVDRLIKSFPNCGLVALPRWSVVRGYPAPDAGAQLLTTARGLSLMAPDRLEEVSRRAQRIRAVRNSAGLPALTITKTKRKKLDEAVDWLLRVDSTAHVYKIKKDASLKATPLKTSEALRLGEVYSLVEIGAVLVGSGALKSVAQAARTKVLAYQKSRSDDGLQPPFDTWVEWCRLRAAQGESKLLPIRLDLPIKTRIATSPKRRGNGPPKKSTSGFVAPKQRQIKKRRKAEAQ